ncbi:MAG: glycerol acyltransferase [Salinarimonadaceae bacterium]|nr:MAG: glycerol acyltransferase [Salinarimonadaceae bacterium]
MAARLPAGERPTLRRKARVFGFFSRYFHRYFRRHMNALRLARWGEPVIPEGAGPIVLYTTHPAWWDAAVYILLADKHFANFANFAPIDAEMLKKYGFFGRMGAYGVDLESPRGAADFLAASADILAREDSAIWVAAQGRFMDVRARPLDLRPGIARLAELAPHAVFIPLAIEYAFWEQRGGEAFVAYGEPIRGEDLAAMEREDRRLHLENKLTAIADRLSADVISREPERFVSLLEGEAGVGGVFDLFKRLVAMLRGKRYDPAHGKRDS